MVEIFAKLPYGLQLLTIFAKYSTIDVQEGPQYDFDFWK